MTNQTQKNIKKAPVSYRTNCKVLDIFNIDPSRAHDDLYLEEQVARTAPSSAAASTTYKKKYTKPNWNRVELRALPNHTLVTKNAKTRQTLTYDLNNSLVRLVSHMQSPNNALLLLKSEGGSRSSFSIVESTAATGAGNNLLFQQQQQLRGLLFRFPSAYVKQNACKAMSGGNNPQHLYEGQSFLTNGGSSSSMTFYDNFGSQENLNGYGQVQTSYLDNAPLQTTSVSRREIDVMQQSQQIQLHQQPVPMDTNYRAAAVDESGARQSYTQQQGPHSNTSMVYLPQPRNSASYRQSAAYEGGNGHFESSSRGGEERSDIFGDTFRSAPLIEPIDVASTSIKTRHTPTSFAQTTKTPNYRAQYFDSELSADYRAPIPQEEPARNHYSSNNMGYSSSNNNNNNNFREPQFDQRQQQEMTRVWNYLDSAIDERDFYRSINHAPAPQRPLNANNRNRAMYRSSDNLPFGYDNGREDSRELYTSTKNVAFDYGRADRGKMDRYFSYDPNYTAIDTSMATAGNGSRYIENKNYNMYRNERRNKPARAQQQETNGYYTKNTIPKSETKRLYYNPISNSMEFDDNGPILWSVTHEPVTYY